MLNPARREFEQLDTLVCLSRLKYTVAREYVGKFVAALQVGKRILLTLDLVKGEREGLRFDFSRTPSASPKTRSPECTITPPQATGVSSAMIRPRPLLSSGAMPP